MSRLRLVIAGGLALACAGQPAPGPESAPQRIIAIAPSVTEMLFELGLGNRVVGVGDYARWPPEVGDKPRLGGLFNARLEAIAAVDPDLAVLLPSEERLRRNLQKMGIEVLTVRSETIEDVEAMAIAIGDRCGVPQRARAFSQRWSGLLAPRPLGRSPNVLLAVTRTPGRIADVLVAGPGTFLHQLLERLGAVNVMADAYLAYPQVGLEEILLRRPDVVIELQASPGTYEDLRRDWRDLGEEMSLAPACVRVVAGDHVLLPGPRLPRLYGELRRALLECAGTP